MQYESEKVKIYVSDNRNHINPHHASFPYILNDDNGIYHLSLSHEVYRTIADVSVFFGALLENPVDTLKTLFSDEMKHLIIRRYISKENITLLSSDEINNFFNDNKFVVYRDDHSIRVSVNEEIIGKVFFTRESFNWSEISLKVNRKYRKRQIGYTLAAYALKNIFNRGKSMIYVCESANAPSVKIAEKLGLELFSEEITGYLIHTI